MKKTWTTRILIALLTLALVGSVFGVAPREAQAAVTAIDIVQGATGTLTASSPTLDLSVTVTSEPGDPTPVIGWSSGTESAVAVVSTGNTTARASVGSLGYGTATITAYVMDDPTINDTIDITVTPSVTVSPKTAAVDIGGKAQLSATTFPPGQSVTWSSANTALVAVSGSGEVTGVGESTSGTTVTAKLTLGGTDYSDTATVTVNKIKPVIQTSVNSISVEKGKDSSFTVTSSNTTGPIAWTATGGTIGGVTSGNCTSGATLTFRAGDTPGTNYTIALTQAPSGNYLAADAKNVPVTVQSANAGLYANVSPTSVQYGGNGISLSAGTTNDTAATDANFSWTVIDGSAAVRNWTDGTTGKAVTIYPASTGTQSVKVKVRVNYSRTGYESASKTVEFTVSPQFDLTTTSLTTKVGYSASTFGVITGPNTTVTAKSNNTKVATVSPASSTSGHIFTVSPVAAGDTTITVSDGVTSKNVAVHVASQVPIIQTPVTIVRDGNPNPTQLSKVFSWTQMIIRVKDYNPANPYVTLTRSNIRTYVQGGAYFSHPSTYTYTAYLTQDGNDGVVELSILAQYNGSTYYTISYPGAVSVNSPTLYVSGFTTLPQTGPNYTWAYVLGGLCLITTATAVTLNVRKKKRESV